MNDYAIVEGAEVTISDIDEARKLDQLVYEEEYFVSLQQCIDWNKRNNRIYTMIRDVSSGNIIAYVNISPVTDEYYEKICSGEFIDTYLPPEAIVDYGFPDLYSLYFSSIVVHPDYQNTAVFLQLFNAITRKFLALGKEEILVKRMVADAVSTKGEKFCELFGMKKRKDSSHGSEIFEVQMLPPQFRISSKPTKELHEYYQQKAQELGLLDVPTPAGDNLKAKTRRPNMIDTTITTPTTVPARIFISYSSKEMEVAGQVCDFLEKNGISCWIAPRNINPGDNYATQIVHAIRSCSVLVLLASESTNASGHVSNEVSLAFDNKKTIIPFKIEDITFSDEYLYFLGRKHWIEAHRDMRAGLEQLLSTIKKLGILPGTKSPDITAAMKPETRLDHAQDELTPSEERAFDRSQEIAATIYSRKEISDLVLKHAIKYSDRGVSRFASSSNFDQLKESANRFLHHCFSITKLNTQAETDDIIGFLSTEILKGSSNVIKITGLPGSGKSVLLQATFYETLLAFKEQKCDLIPFYISLGYFENAPYSSESLAEQAKALITKELSEYVSFLTKNADVTPIIFVNGVREHIIGKVSLENVLQDVLKENGIHKYIVTVDSGLLNDRSRLKRVIPIISGRIPTFFESHKVDAHDEDVAKEFIAAVTSFYDCNIATERVFKTLKTLKFQELDPFIIRTIADEMLSSTKPITNISDIYEKWALTEFYGDEEKLLDAAQKAFSYMFNEDFQVADYHFNDTQWSLIHQHQTFLDFLLSYHIIRKMEAADSTKDFDCHLLSIMLTASTDMFVSAFLRDNHQLQSKVLHIVIDNYDSFTTVQKSSANFWLAKITFKNLVGEAVSFLKPIYNELKPLVKKRDNTTQENYDNQFFFRSICFALIIFGQTSILDDYLCLIVTNDSANAINRGAIVEYYSDHYQMVANEVYCLDTDIAAGTSAIKALSWKINKVLLPGADRFPEMDLLTLSTLLQKRIQSNESKELPEIVQWVSDFMVALDTYQKRPQNIHSEKIEFYFASVHDDFEIFLNSNGNFDVSQYIYNTLRGLKDVKRKQWRTHDVIDPESVSEHSFSAWMLAMLFLPEELPYEGYLKREVLDMVLIHDMAEAKLGDQLVPLNEPSKDLIPQNRVMRKFLVKGTYPNVANLTYYYNVWTGYFNGVNINAKIARDINLIQTIYTFCEYYTRYPDKFSADDHSRWMQEKGKLETDIGFKIYEILVERNADFDVGSTGAAFEPVDPQGSDSHPVTREDMVPAAGNKGGNHYRVKSYTDLIDADSDIDEIRAEITSIVNSVIPAENNQGLENHMKILENISENWRVILDQDNQLVGYWVFVALPTEYFERAKSGELNEKEITLDTIEYIDFPGTYHGYLLLSGTKPEARTAELVQELYRSLAAHLEQLAAKGIFFDEICAVAESPAGKSALRKMGMSKIGTHFFGGDVLACSLMRIEENPYFSAFKELRSLYEQYFS